MKNLTFHIVGLTHNDVKGHEVEYAKEAEGRTICLVPDDANTFDMLAVKAYDKQQLIGYVSALEGEDVLLNSVMISLLLAFSIGIFSFSNTSRQFCKIIAYDFCL